jgi:hypothetical protein
MNLGFIKKTSTKLCQVKIEIILPMTSSYFMDLNKEFVELQQFTGGNFRQPFCFS